MRCASVNQRHRIMAGVTWRGGAIVLLLILVTRYAACDVSLQAINAPQEYNYMFSRFNTTGINATETIIITAADDLIQLEVSSSEKLSDQACAEGPIQIYTGQSRLFHGSYCGGEIEYFSSSHLVLVIVVNTTSLPDNIEIDFLYEYVVRGGRITASRTPRFLYTSNYPDGGSFQNNSDWRIREPNDATDLSTMFFTLKYADVNYIPDCGLTNVTLTTLHGGSLSYILHKNYVWCGQKENTFSSTFRNAYVSSFGQTSLESGLEIMIWAEEVTQCKHEIATTADPTLIQSPGFPNGYPPHTNCRWYAALYQSNAYGYYLLQVDVVDIDCENDVLEILNTSPSYQTSRKKIECENETFVTEYYTDYLQVWFISGSKKNSSAHTGFSMTVQRLNETSCYTELVATDSVQKLSLNVTVPGHGICKWVFRVSNPVMVVKIQIKNYQPWCLNKKNRIYDGLTEDMYSALNDVCGNGFYQSTGANLNIVMSSLTDTFREEIEFWQGQYSRNLTVREMVNYPFEQGNYKSGADVTWTITLASSERIGVTFDKMDVNCEGDAIYVRDGEKTLSICGSQDRQILSKTHSLVVNFKSTTNQGTGFRMRHYDYTIKACGDSIIDVNINQCRFDSPSYIYFDNLLCKWRISSSKDNRIKLIITVDEINTTSPTSCEGDYLQIYDGNSKTARSLPRVCGADKEVTLESSGNEMYVEFITDSVLAGTGFEARCSTFKPAESGLSTGAIVGIAILVVFVLAMGCLLYFCIKKKRRGEGNLTHTATPLGPAGETRTFIPPPSYDELSPNSHNGGSSPPPTYDNVVKTTDTKHNSQAVTSSL